MKYFEWNPEKNHQLLEERGISFEDVVYFLLNDGLLADIVHPNQEKHPNQRVFVVNMDGYAYLVPYVDLKDTAFLKTVIPGRKATRKYLGE